MTLRVAAKTRFDRRTSEVCAARLQPAQEVENSQREIRNHEGSLATDRSNSSQFVRTLVGSRQRLAIGCHFAARWVQVLTAASPCVFAGLGDPSVTAAAAVARQTTAASLCLDPSRQAMPQARRGARSS